MDNETLTWLIVALVVVAIGVIAVIASRRRSLKRSAALRQRFGPEYDRALAEHGTAARAERELAARAQRVERIQIRELNAGDRARYQGAWTEIQARFVDDPALAVSDANELINRVMRARGYPMEDFEQRVADLSVDHPLVVQHYRAARVLVASSGGAQVNTEDLRQAMVHYRFLCADLLQAPEPLHRMRESHA
jgi:hypothetical protein